MFVNCSACIYVYFVLMYCSCYWVLFQYAIRYARIYECECVLAVSYKQHIWDYFTPLVTDLQRLDLFGKELIGDSGFFKYTLDKA